MSSQSQVSNASSDSSLFSNVLPLPTSNLRAATLEPRSFAPDFDVAHELLNRPGTYTGDKWLSMFGLPGYLLTSIRRLKATIKETQSQLAATTATMPRPVGIAPIYNCCISYGIRQLANHSELLQLVRLRDKINLIDNVDPIAAELVNEWFGGFRVSIADASAGPVSSKRQNIPVSVDLHVDIQHLADSLGVTISTMAILSTSVTLSLQTGMLDSHMALMDHSIAAFIKRSYSRRRIGESLYLLLLESQRWT